MNNEEILNYAKKIADNDKQTINDIFTNSSHKRIILQELNTLLTNNPDWSYSLLAISRYYKEQWILSLNFESYEKYDIFSDNLLKRSKQKYELSSNIVSIILNFIKNENTKLTYFHNKNQLLAFEAAFCPGSTDVSKYIMNTHLNDALKAYCLATNKKIKKCFKEYNNIVLKEFDDDQLNVYHNTKYLVKTLRSTLKKRKILSNINEQNLYRMLNDYLLIIKKYPSDGEIMFTILNYYIYSGYSDFKIGSMCYRSEFYVRAKKEQALEILSLILWGYSIKALIYNIN